MKILIEILALFMVAIGGFSGISKLDDHPNTALLVVLTGIIIFVLAL